MADAKDLRVVHTEGPDLTDVVVAVRIRGQERLFNVHANILRRRSQHLRKKIDKATYGTSTPIILDECDLETLETYLRYLYTGKLSCLQVNEEGEVEGRWEDDELLVKLYVFGVSIRDDAVCDAVISSLLKEFITEQLIPNEDIVSLVYKRCAARSPLRRLMVDIHIWFGTGQSLAIPSKYPKEFFVDLSRASLEEIAYSRGHLGPSDDVRCCDYHAHAKDAECGNKKRKRKDEDEDEDEESEEGSEGDDEQTEKATDTATSEGAKRQKSS